MNIEQANALSIKSILDKLNMTPTKEKGFDLWYNSPFRKEKTASFHIHTKKNVWYDFGEAKGGGTVDFVCTYMQAQGEDHTVVDALRWLKNMNYVFPLTSCSKEAAPDYGTILKMEKVASLNSATFIKYLRSRGIPFAAAKKYLKEVQVSNRNTGKKFTAIGLANENGGFELRNKFFKGSVAQKGISFIRGSKHNSGEIHLFEGMMDFLSAVTYQKDYSFEGDVIVLNSLSCLSQAFPYIKNYNYKKLYAWLDNDTAGGKASKLIAEFIANQQDILHKRMNFSYVSHKDVNAWHMHNHNLTP